MQNIKLFIELTRLNRPIGYMLLFWPCLWGLTIAYDFNSELEKFQHLAKTIENVAIDHGLRFDESTEANFRALRGAVRPDDSDDPRDKTPYPDNYRGTGI